MSRPNVMLICFDHWPGMLLGVAGHPKILSPSVDQIAQSGVLFTQAYTCTPTCIPARRELFTGVFARTHGDRCFSERMEMPKLPTMPGVFGQAGYQTSAVGKLHVYPQRDRIGFDTVILHEEGRHHLGGGKDDYELFLQDQGYAGQELTHAMGNNQYCVRPWHLPESCHPTNWATRQMCRTIQRRDPTQPAFWYCSYAAPHPPITPPESYLNMYYRIGVDEPFVGPWAEDTDHLPYALKVHRGKFPPMSHDEIRLARMGFYAQCTYIDHQLRLIIGTLREEGLLDNTIVLLTCDHGDMLGNHGLWAKRPMFEWGTRIPMVLMPTADCRRVGYNQTDDRLVCLADVMPTLLDLCDIPIPPSVEGQSLLSDRRRDFLYAEHYEDEQAMRMVRSGRHKLIWYPAGNRFQLFDVQADPREMHDLAGQGEHQSVRAELTQRLVESLYGSDLEWVKDGQLVGCPAPPYAPKPYRSLANQRGWR